MQEMLNVDAAQEQLTAVAAEFATRATWPMSEAELVTFLDCVHSAQQMLHAALLHAVREVEGRGIATAERATSPPVWLRGRLRISIAAATRLIEQARLTHNDAAVDAAISTGQINAEQLEAITRALGDLPADLDASIRAEAATTLTFWAAHLDPRELRKAGKRILRHVAPELDEATEEERLRREEQAAHKQRHVTLSPLGDGRVRLHGILDVKAAAIVTAALDPLCKPSGTADELAESGEARTPGQRRADALVEICRLALAGGTLPDNGGDRPQLTITASYDAVRGQLGGGVTDAGDPVSAATVRQMACDARILPLVFDGDGQVLDAGRSRRLVTGPLRRALNARDEGCAFPGCDRPARWCDAHHIVAWADGGKTDLLNLVLLCEHHHHAVHEEGGWQVRAGGDGRPDFIPPAWLDPEQAPRRNPYHRRT